MVHESGKYHKKWKGDVQQIAVNQWNQSVPVTKRSGRTKGGYNTKT
jgi:hypothetical protein